MPSRLQISQDTKVLLKRTMEREHLESETGESFESSPVKWLLESFCYEVREIFWLL